MAKLNKAIPAVLVHCEGDKEYRVNGQIVSINESAGTVSMRFNNHNKIEHDIPMESIYLNEGIIDSIKNIGSKLKKSVETLIRKVKGFLFPVNEDGSLDRDVMGVGVNIAVQAANGELPAGVTFYPSQTVIDYAAEQGTRCNKPGYDIADSMAERESEAIEKYWTRVMNAFVKNESYTAHDAIKAVNESYVKRYNAIRKKAGVLNEAVWSLENNSQNRTQYGNELNFEDSVNRVLANIYAQIDRQPGDPMPRPIVIWGAPGIGKTSIIREVTNIIKEEDGLDLMFLELSCAGLNYEDWGLPTTASRVKNHSKDDADDMYATAAPQHWLPVFEHSGSPADIKAKDEFYNSGRFYNGENTSKTYDGGILFLDELTQLPVSASKLLQELAGTRKYNGKELASRWALIFASNRYEDIDLDTAERDAFYWDDAQKGRYTSITFVPDFEDWLKWAAEVNPKTGRAHVDKMFTDFIKQGGKHLWYDVLTWPDETPGSRDEQLSPDQKNTINSMKTGAEPFDWQTIRQDILHDPKLAGQTNWNPREWEAAINDEVINKLLQKLWFRGNPNLYNSIFDEDGNIDRTKLRDALEMLPPRKWKSIATRKYDPTGNTDRLTVFDNYVADVIKGKAGDGTVVDRDWQTFTAYRRVFTPDVCESIWATGSMPGNLGKEDDMWYSSPTDYRNQESTRWKSMSSTLNEVIKIVLQHGMTDELVDALHDDLKAGRPNIPDAQAKTLVTKWKKYGTIKAGNKSYPLLITTGSENSKIAKDIAVTLETSNAARRMVNAALWCAKCAIQSGAQNSAIGQTLMDAFNLYRGDLVKKFSVKYPEDAQDFTGVSAIIKKSNDAFAAGKKMDSNEMIAQSADIISNTLMYPPFAVGRNMKMITVTIIQKGEYQ